MINIIITFAVVWAIYQVYMNIFHPKKEGCDKCIKK